MSWIGLRGWMKYGVVWSGLVCSVGFLCRGSGCDHTFLQSLVLVSPTPPSPSLSRSGEITVKTRAGWLVVMRLRLISIVILHGQCVVGSCSSFRFVSFRRVCALVLLLYMFPQQQRDARSSHLQQKRFKVQSRKATIK
jgi:hypothetical protein